MVGVGVVV